MRVSYISQHIVACFRSATFCRETNGWSNNTPWGTSLYAPLNISCIGCNAWLTVYFTFLCHPFATSIRWTIRGASILPCRLKPLRQVRQPAGFCWLNWLWQSHFVHVEQCEMCCSNSLNCTVVPVSLSLFILFLVQKKVVTPMLIYSRMFDLLLLRQLPIQIYWFKYLLVRMILETQKTNTNGRYLLHHQELLSW